MSATPQIMHVASTDIDYKATSLQSSTTYSQDKISQKSSWWSNTLAGQGSQYVDPGTRLPLTLTFGMAIPYIAQVVAAAEAAACAKTGLDAVGARARQIFDGVWGGVKTQAEARIAAIKAELQQIADSRVALKSAQAGVPATESVRTGPLGLRAGWLEKSLLVALVAILGTLIVCELVSASTLRVFELQSRPIALLTVTPLLGIICAMELLLRRDPRPWLRALQIGFHVVGAVAVAAWMASFARNYAGTLREDFVLPSLGATVTFTLAQLMAGLAGSAWLTMLIGARLTPSVVVRKSAEWAAFETEIGKLDHRANGMRILLGREEGVLVTYQASSAAFVGYGEDAYQRTKLRLELLEAKLKLTEGA